MFYLYLSGIQQAYYGIYYDLRALCPLTQMMGTSSYTNFANNYYTAASDGGGEACRLVLEAGVKGDGGEIFVFDMGKPVKIADLAKRMIKLSGAKNVEIAYTGLREGEKLYEETLTSSEATLSSFHNKIRIAKVREMDYSTVSTAIDELIELSESYDDLVTVKKMKEIVPEYKSNNSKFCILDKETTKP